MITKKRFLGILGIAMIIIFGFSSGINSYQYIFNRLENYVSKEAPEKIYLHTDKEYYTNGETIWFKSYLVDGITHSTTAKSKVSYVELINPSDSIVARRTIYTDNIGADGDIVIDKNWATGTYLLRSYTNYMRNSKKHIFFQKEIPVWNQKIAEEEIYQSTSAIHPQDSIVLSSTNKDNSELITPTLKFYPEGGRLIADMNNTLGIHATDGLGNGIPLMGSIVDENGNKEMLFRSYKFGLGKVMFKPEKGKKYSAILTVNGKEKKYPLPTVEDNGYRLAIKNTDDNIIIDVRSTQKNGLYNSLLIGHLRGKTFFKHIEPKGTDRYSVKLLIKDLDDGVAHFTLFTPSGEAVCERLVFIDNPENDVNLAIKTNKKTYNNRDRVVIDVAPTDNKGALLEGDFSMNVVRLDSLEKRAETGDIRSWLLLDSDLKGTIENPGYFFEDDGKGNRKFLLDALLLTHGWRRFVWKEFLQHENSQKETFRVEQGLFINGKTTMFNKPFATKQSLTSLTFMEKGIYQDKKMTTKTGRFSFGPFFFKDSIDTVIEAVFPEVKGERKKKDISIFIDGPTPGPPVEHFDTKKNIQENKEYITRFLQESRFKKVTNFKYNPEANQLDEVILSVKKKSVTEQLTDKYGESPHRLIIDSAYGAQSQSIIDILGQMARVNVTGTYPDVKISVRGGGSLSFNNNFELDPLTQQPIDNSPLLSSGPLILLDQAEVTLDFIVGLSASEVLFIDVFRPEEALVYGSRGAQGVISIYTGIGSEFIKQLEQSPGITNFKIPGFYQAREFFTPNYSKKQPEHLFPDYRTTLHWEPYIRTTTKSSSKIDFYTCDSKGLYLIKVEGVTYDGRVVKKVKEVLVE